MPTEITLDDDQAQTLDRLLAMAEEADCMADAFYLDEASTQRVSDLRDDLDL